MLREGDLVPREGCHAELRPLGRVATQTAWQLRPLGRVATRSAQQSRSLGKSCHADRVATPYITPFARAAVWSGRGGAGGAGLGVRGHTFCVNPVREHSTAVEIHGDLLTDSKTLVQIILTSPEHNPYLRCCDHKCRGPGTVEYNCVGWSLLPS